MRVGPPSLSFCCACASLFWYLNIVCACVHDRGDFRQSKGTWWLYQRLWLDRYVASGAWAEKIVVFIMFLDDRRTVEATLGKQRMAIYDS